MNHGSRRRLQAGHQGVLGYGPLRRLPGWSGIIQHMPVYPLLEAGVFKVLGVGVVADAAESRWTSAS